ncbi:hypothetical protein R1sor_018347 [Riccia sorocarpa]|uniref:Ribosome-binding factor A n=1 Tax=Riccia sorocarpa TaxID=122646 RepID=A0ABD3ID61_9MARC
MLRRILVSSAGAIRRGTAAPASSAGFQFPLLTDKSRNYRSHQREPTLRQKRIASEVKEVIGEALQQGPCESPIVKRAGFEITDVEMSSDLRTAHILWRALPGMQKSAEKAVLSNVKRLRSLIFSRLTLPFSPALKFQEDTLPPHVQALEEAFAKLKEEEGEPPAEESPAASRENSKALQNRTEIPLDVEDTYPRATKIPKPDNALPNVMIDRS